MTYMPTPIKGPYRWQLVYIPRIYRINKNYVKETRNGLSINKLFMALKNHLQEKKTENTQQNKRNNISVILVVGIYFSHLMESREARIKRERRMLTCFCLRMHVLL